MVVSMPFLNCLDLCGFSYASDHCMACMVYRNKCDVRAHVIHCAMEPRVCCNKCDVYAHGCVLCLRHDFLITYHALETHQPKTSALHHYPKDDTRGGPGWYTT